jgi:signal transduction histidine kinase
VSSTGLWPELAAAFLERLLAGRCSAWVHLDAAGRPLAAGGDGARFGVVQGAAALELGPIGDALLELESPSRAGESWPRLEYRPGAFADVHRVALQGGASALLVVDVTDEAERWRRVQQEHHATLLALERGEAPAEEAVLAEVLSSLDALALEQDAAGELWHLAGRPAWADGVLGPAAASNAALAAAALSPFLEHFLEDARALWSSGAPGRVASGPWSETLEERELVLEATAHLLPSGRRLLVVRSAEEAGQERQRWLQRARETTLSYKALRQEIEKKEILLACIVHDLKGPLTGMTGALSMLEHGVQKERADALIAMGLREARAQRRLVHEVLELFTSELARFDAAAAIGAADLVQAAEEVLEGQRGELEQRQVTALFTPLAPGEDARVVGSPDALRRIFANLLENAVRHSPPGAVVELALAAEPAALVVEVRDRGPGIPPELAESLFRPRARGPGGGSAGLGLFYCVSTLRRLGGVFGQRPREGGGSIFWFRLPRRGRGEEA